MSSSEPQPAVADPEAPLADPPAERSPWLDPENAPLPPRGLLRQHHWLTVLMPFLVYMLVMFMFESGIRPADATPPPDKPFEEMTREEKEHKEEWEHGIPREHYPRIYTAKIAATAIAMLLVVPGYLYFRGAPSWRGLLVGLVGGAVWIGLCKLHLEPKILGPLGLDKFLDLGRRPGFNPFVELKDNPSWAYQFLAIRLIGLVVIVPIIEEFFLRGWLMRYVMHVDWPEIPFAVVDRTALIAGTAVPMLMHTGELFAAAAWFSLVTWLMLRTKSIWECILAHAVTNLMIGLWVIVPTLQGKEADWWLM